MKKPLKKGYLRKDKPIYLPFMDKNNKENLTIQYI